MAYNIINNEFLSKTMKCNVKQNTYNGRKGQDFARVGSNEEFDWAAVADGHGNSSVIDIIREFDWVNHIKSENFHELLNIEIEKIDSTRCGSTLSVVKIYPDRFESFWLGDSSIKIYSEGKSVWEMDCHDGNNFNEMEKMRDDKNVKIIERGIDKEIICKPHALNSKKMEMIPSMYFIFGLVDKINMTHALGHNFLTGKSISKKIISRREGQKYKVLVATDGLWDISCDDDIIYFSNPELNSKDHIEMANERWRQEWIYCGEKTRFPESNFDDVAIATWSN